MKIRWEESPLHGKLGYLGKFRIFSLSWNVSQTRDGEKSDSVVLGCGWLYAKEASMFKVGGRVEWWSGAGRGWLRKEGVVVAVVAPAEYPLEHPFVNTHKFMFDTPSLTRNHESYLVEVRRFAGDKAKPRLYWPRVSQLGEVT